MDSQKTSQIRAHAARFYRQGRDLIVGLSPTMRVSLGLFSIAVVMLILHLVLSEKNAKLRLTVQHGFRSADISLFVDGDLAYSGKLTGAAKKKLGLIPGGVQGTISETLPVAAGIHQIRVQVHPDGGSTQQNTVAGDFAAHSERKLAVTARPGNLSVAWQGATTPPGSTESNWFSQYASAIFLTIGGSIVSALTGFALRELPAHIRARQEAAVKARSTAAGQ
jgi:hypothetical protein